MSAHTTTAPAATVWRTSSHSGSHYGGNCVQAAVLTVRPVPGDCHGACTLCGGSGSLGGAACGLCGGTGRCGGH